MKSSVRNFIGVFLVLLLVCILVSVLPAIERITAEGLVANHLRSIGSADKLAARKTCVAEGQGSIHLISGGLGTLQGSSQFISEGDRIRLSMNFNSPDYPAEQLAYDGKHFNIAFLRPGIRSDLGNFLNSYNFLVKEGLVGGVLSTAWPLTNLSAHAAKVHYDGIKKIDGVDLHELRYSPRKGDSTFSILLYFDPATFHHVKSIYKVTIPTQLTTESLSDSHNQSNINLHMEERFDDFKEVDGLTLPMHWNIYLKIEGAGGPAAPFPVVHCRQWNNDLTFEGQSTSAITEWNSNFTKVSFNQPLKVNDFTIR